MKKLFVATATCLLLGACGNDTKTTVQRDGNGPTPPPPPTQKLEPGNDLVFLCADTEKGTMVGLTATWEPPITAWAVILEEKDLSGSLITRKDALRGTPDELEDFQMNLIEGGDLYARLIQVSDTKAVYLDRKRRLDCAFK